MIRSILLWLIVHYGGHDFSGSRMLCIIGGDMKFKIPDIWQTLCEYVWGWMKVCVNHIGLLITLTIVTLWEDLAILAGL